MTVWTKVLIDCNFEVRRVSHTYIILDGVTNMAKQKLRKIAKNIGKQPKLKKKLAEYLASTHNKVTPDELTNMLLKGHRGYLAMTEKELTDLFDKKYESLTIQLQDLKTEEAELKTGIRKRSYWGDYGKGIKKVQEQIDQADTVYDALFEEVFL